MPCRVVAEKALGHPTLEAELGPPLSLGSWASTSFGFSNGRRMANMCVPVTGSRQSCDVTTKVGFASLLCCGGEWERGKSHGALGKVDATLQTRIL